MSGADITLNIQGLKELEAQLAKLGKDIPGIMAKGLKGPMEHVVADARALVPRDTGALQDSIAITPVKRATARRASMADALSEVGVRIKKMKELARAQYTNKGARNRIPNPRKYWHLVEFGTSHSAAQPYLRPAFDKNVDRMIAEFKTITRDQIERVHARYANRRKRRRR